MDTGVQAPENREEEHIVSIQIGDSPSNWWNVTLTVQIHGEKPVEVRVTEIEQAP